MATKAAKFREASTEELYENVEELKAELFSLRFQKATGRLDDYKRLREVRREIARALSVLRERELGIEPRPKLEEPEVRRRKRLFRRRPVVEAEPEDEDRDESEEGEDLEEAEVDEEIERDDVVEDEEGEQGEDIQRAKDVKR